MKDHDVFNNPPPADNDATRAVLVRELRVAREFTLIFAVSRAGEERARLMEAVKRDLPDFRIQEIPVRREVPHLLHVIRSVLDAPAPNVVFVYGMENWISGNDPPRSIPFIANLNASRNNFTRDCPCPVVFWIPEFLLGMISEGAPDFFSVRSGLYYFADAPNAPSESNAERFSVSTMDDTVLLGLSPKERQARRKEMQALLEQIRVVPETNRDLLAEARVLSELAKLDYVEAEYDEALPLAERALAIREQVLGANHSDTAESLNNLAILYRSLNRCDEALPLYERALAIREEVLGAMHPDTALSLNNLASLYYELNRYDEALSLAERALEIREQMLGANHPEAASSLNDLAYLYDNLNRYDEALPLYERALAIREEVLGARHPDTAASLNNLALLYESLSRYDDALPLYERALEICVQALGHQHPNTITVVNNLSRLHKKMELTE